VPFRRVDPVYTFWSGLIGLLERVSSAGTATRLAAPWPRLLISAGLRNEPIARWIRAQSNGATRVVFLGRTWAALNRFDLVVTTPQYRLRRAANLIQNPLTLHAVNAARLAAARRVWQPQFGRSAGLRVGVLLGGDSGPYAFDENFAARLATELNRLAQESAATYLVSSSSRTPAGFLAALERDLAGEHYLHAWGDAGENPYFGILAWSDLIIVSADSIAMISEALATGKRVLLTEPTCGGSPRARIYRSAMSWGHRRWTRDVSLIHTALVESGLIGWLRSPEDRAKAVAAAGSVSEPSLTYQKSTVEQVRKLLD